MLQFPADTADRFPWASLVDTDFAFDRVEDALQKSAQRELRRASIVMA